MSGATIGDVLVHCGEPPGGNPYRGNSLFGDARVRALTIWKHGGDASPWTFWYAPACGGARKISPGEVDWESSGIR